MPKHVQGRSLARALDDPEHVVHEAVYCLRGRNDHVWRTDRWALIRYGKGGVELYDMQSDPYQFTNLARAVKHKETVTRLLAQLDEHLKGMK